MQFVSEGGERRRPKRAAASAYATRSADVSVPSDQDKDSRFQEMIATTRRNAEWGSSEHIQAFCQAYKLDVTVYTMNAVHPFQDVNATPGESRNVIHIAYHVSSSLSPLPLCLQSQANNRRNSNITPLYGALEKRTKASWPI